MILTREDLHDYQMKAINFILNKKKVALFLDMGLGKTISTLTAIKDLKYNKFKINKVLIVAPLRVCNTVWEQEAKKWVHTQSLTFANLAGGKTNMSTNLKKYADIYLINRENISTLVEYLDKNWDFDMMIIDESSSFKSPSSKRFKALKKVVAKLNYTVLLTGTPSPNGYLDLWSQIYLLDMGRRLGPKIIIYRNRYFALDSMGYSYEPRYGAIKNIQNKIKDVVLSMSAEDYLQLPKVISTIQYQNMPKELISKYKKFKKNMILDFKNKDRITVMSASVLTNKLLQFCSGNMYDENNKVHHIHNLKIDMLKEIIEDNPNETFLIAYNYKHEFENLKKHFKEAITLDKDQKTIEKWNKREIKILLAHPASAGHGLNLQYGGNNIIWYGFTWSLELYQQFNARLNRQGQTKPLTITHLAVGDIEYKLMEILAKKDVSQTELLNSLK